MTPPIPRSSIIMMIIMLIISIAQASTLSSSEANALFSTANAAYRAEKFDEAKAAYIQLLNGGYKTPEILYNIGTTSARLNQPGEAIAYLTFAHRLDPHNADVEANLNRARAQQSSSTPAEDDRSTILTRILDSLTTSEWLLLAWLPLLLLCICVSLRAFTTARPWARLLKPLAIFSALLFAVLAIPAAIQVYRTRYMPESIALASAEVHSGPGKNFTAIHTLKPGDLLHSATQDQPGDFRLVHLPDGRKGYVPADAILSLR